MDVTAQTCELLAFCGRRGEGGRGEGGEGRGGGGGEERGKSARWMSLHRHELLAFCVASLLSVSLICSPS